MSPQKYLLNTVRHNVFFLACLRLILPSFLPVTLGGAALFLLFGIIYLYEAFAVDMDHNIPEHL